MKLSSGLKLKNKWEKKVYGNVIIVISFVRSFFSFVHFFRSHASLFVRSFIYLQVRLPIHAFVYPSIHST